MSTITIDPNELKKMASQISGLANKFQTSLDNTIWNANLPTFERLMLQDAKNEFIANLLGVGVETSLQYRRTSQEFSSIRDFYENEAKRLQSLQEFGYSPSKTSQFDPNLTLSEAVELYLRCSLEEAMIIYDSVSKAEDEWIFQEAKIREKYNGNLETILGKNKEDYIERANLNDQATTEALKQMREAFQQHLGPIGRTSLDDINPDEFAPRMK